MHTYFTGSNNSSGACSLQTKFNPRVELCRTVKNEQEVVCMYGRSRLQASGWGWGGKKKWETLGVCLDDGQTTSTSVEMMAMATANDEITP